MKIILATGGTGGHIYPALSLAQFLKEKHEILFVGSEERMEKTLIPEYGYAFKSIKVNSYEGNVFDRIKALVSVSSSYFSAKKIIKKFQPDLIIGFGGYVSLPVLLAGQHLKIKTMIHEQNSVMGKTNKIVYDKVDGVIVCYKNLLSEYPDAKVRLLGNPRATEILNSFDPTYYQSLKLDKNKKKVLFVMGSQGSVTMSHKIIDFLNQADPQYEYLYVLGKRDYLDFKDKIVNEKVHVYDYLDLGKILQEIDLIVARAGATTVAEITSLGKASILIPSPFVAHNHQNINANALIKEKASVRIREEDVSIERLNHSISQILENTEFKNTLESNALKLGTPNAIFDIIDFVEEILNGR